MATFPAYAQILFKDYSQKRESALLRSEMESGPPKQARVRFNVMITRSVKIYLSSTANFLAFEEWYKTDLAEGSAWFNFVDPVSGSTIQARFVNGGYVATPMIANMDHWEVSAQIESWSV